MRFLVARHGFRAVERSVAPEGTNWMGAIVRYKRVVTHAGKPSDGWTVSLSYAPARLELSLDISDGTSNGFSVAELNSLENGVPMPRGTHRLYESVHDTEAQYVEFDRLAAVLRASGARFFAGDASLWSDLQARRELAWQADEDRRAAIQSEVAFRAKDWSKVVLLLEPRSPRLAGAAAARLSFARKKLQGAA